MRQFLYIAVLILIGCGQKNNKDKSSLTVSDSTDKVTDLSSDSPTKTSEVHQIKLDSFTDIPKEIKGCSCYYSESESKYNSNEYLLVADFDSAGYISIDKTIIKLKLVSTGRQPNSFGDYDHIDVFRTDNYTITLDIKYKDGADEEDEGWYTDGTITIEDKDGQKTRLTFFGSCGC